MTTLPKGTTMLRDFSRGSYYARLGAVGEAFSGSGRGAGGTLLRLAPHSSTRRKSVPTKKGSTNPLYMVKMLGGAGLKIHDFAVEGTPQGHLFGGLRLDKSASPELYELCITGIPGNSDINPGETFLENLWRCSNVSVHDTELDGGGIGASGLGLNTCSGLAHVARLTAHDLKYCKGIAVWMHDGDIVIDDYESLNNAFAIGLERSDGVVTMNRPKFVNSRRADVHLANDGGQYGRTKLLIRDPRLKPGQKVKVLLSKTELGRPNKQTASDVSLTVNGQERRDLLQFVTRA